MRNRVLSIRSILFLSALVLLAFSTACQQAQLAEYRPYPNDHEVPRMTVEQAKKDVDSGIAVIVDSRDANAYGQEHIAGAINIPSGAPSDEELAKLPKGKKIIVYCS